MLSDAPEEHVETLEAFGESLGIAFQLSDDIMDITACQLELGKEPGTDIREGVYTVPVLHALRDGADSDELQRILAHGAPDGELLDRALELVVARAASIEHARAPVAAEVRSARSASRAAPGRHRRATRSSSSRGSSRCAAARRCGVTEVPSGEARC